MTGRARWVAPLLDLAVLVVFVAVGRNTHGAADGVEGFARTLWPFLVGWFGVALLVRAYRDPLQPMTFLPAAVLGLAAAFVLRRLVVGRLTLPFVLVTVGFVLACTIGWRLVAWVIVRLAARRAGTAASRA